MRLRHRATPDTPAERARLAFTISSDDADVKSCLDIPVGGPPQPPRTSRYEPYLPPGGRGRDRERVSRDNDVRPRAANVSSGNMVPTRFRSLEGVCFEWCKGGMPEVDSANPCPGVQGGRARCDWDHVIPSGTSSSLLNEFQDWCKARVPRSGRSATGAQRRARKRGSAGGDE